MVNDVELIVNRCVAHGLSIPQCAYVLATVQHETNGQYLPVKEAYWLGEDWRRRNLRYYPWYGRGYVQLTWKANYQKAANYFNKPQLMEVPDLMITDKNLSADVLIIGMFWGWFGQPMHRYINKERKDYRNARRSVNVMDKADLIARYAVEWGEGVTFVRLEESMGLRRNTQLRQVPTESDKAQALFSVKKFADLIYFHGGMSNFGKIHHDGLDWTESRVGLPVTRELILMPRSHLKTTVFTVLDVLHNIYINPNVRCYIGSANQNLSKAILREITANLVDPWLQEYVWNVRPHFNGRLIPLMDKGAIQRRQVRLEESGEFSDFESDALDYSDDKKKIWRQEAIQVIRPYKLKEPTVVIGSVDSPATGFHYDRMYFDDIINFDNYDKPEKIERLDTWRNDMFSVLDDSYQDDDLYDVLKQAQFKRRGITIEDARKRSQVGGFVRTVGTRYFKHDWYKQIIDASATDETHTKWDTWVRNIYVNSENHSDGYLWKERWSQETEKRKRSEMTRKHFYAQYLNKVIVDEEQVIPMDRIKGLRHSDISFVAQGSPRIYVERFPGQRVEVALHMCIDPAATVTPDADFTAFAVGGKDKEGNLYIVELLVMRKTSDGWIRKMYEVLEKWNLKSVHLETVAFASELKNTIKMKFNKDGFYPISIRDYKPGVKSSKKERIESGLEPLISNEMLFLTASAFNSSEIQDQFNFFPSETVKDDAPDVVQMVNEVAKKTQPLSKVVPINRQVNNRWGGFY